MTLSGTTNPGWSEPGSDGITRTSPSDCLESYLRHSLVGASYASAEMQSLNSAAPADWPTLNTIFGFNLIVVKYWRSRQSLIPLLILHKY